MATSIMVKTKIRLNGQEYSGVEEMPAEIRLLYERALAAVAGGGDGSLLKSIAGSTSATASAALSTKIVFNGQEYASVEQMPAAVRRLYEDVIATIETAEKSGAGAPASAGPASAGAPLFGSAPRSSATIEPLRAESTSMRLVIAGAVMAALLLASFVLRH